MRLIVSCDSLSQQKKGPSTFRCWSLARGGRPGNGSCANRPAWCSSCGTLIFARRSSPVESDKDEAEHNERDDGGQSSDTPRRGRRAHSAIEATPDVRQRNE